MIRLLLAALVAVGSVAAWQYIRAEQLAEIVGRVRTLERQQEIDSETDHLTDDELRRALEHVLGAE
ncbi:hypothetical protein [Mameliella alba]|uniref:hypothetical protein n=1 Tax=Mameliella alba TaxID=561184 RepID=UPI00088E3DE1|nr:hypothetical protein [Mameliella alba]OWV39390.1 hypothetical protein CDZ95_26035 [Mameliella alba]OWV46498.1 hypothetical protein CDZ96_17970 [Mameliella alba]PTR37311.1 hypothetical protein LX94_03650 [Mameliella alba]SDD76040.1 hypothetical protein SAMN05216376_111113 [Mameliella alba]GGF73716.1 hypothetical protein GCM10011319_37820 [Mameliella alba]